MSIETINLTHGVTVKIEQDTDCESPGEWDNVGKITYNDRSRYVLGTEAVSQERFEEIVAGIKDGSLIGLPVYAYVHGMATIRVGQGNPFAGQDPGEWDSGLSGVVYCTRAKAIEEWGKKRMTKRVKEMALKYMTGEVETFDQYLRGEVYGYVVECNGDIKDSCWGFYGIDCAREEARHAGELEVLEQIDEAAERQACEERDIVTVAP